MITKFKSLDDIKGDYFMVKTLVKNILSNHDVKDDEVVELLNDIVGHLEYADAKLTYTIKSGMDIRADD